MKKAASHSNAKNFELCYIRQKIGKQKAIDNEKLWIFVPAGNLHSAALSQRNCEAQ